MIQTSSILKYSTTLLLILYLAQPGAVLALGKWNGFSSDSHSPQTAAALKNNGDFGLGWKPKPLKNPNIQPASVVPKATAPAQPVNPSAEAFLRPMLPFISAVENDLHIKPPVKQSIQNRLNQLQMVLFGGLTYQDAGECLAKIAQLFPEEAAKSRQQMLADMQKNMLQPKSIHLTGKPTRIQSNSDLNKLFKEASSEGGSSSQGVNANGIPLFQTPPSSTVPSQGQPASTVHKRSFWQRLHSDDDMANWNDEDPFKNDPFFNSSNTSSNTYSSNTKPPTGYVQQKAPKGQALRALGQGVLGLAAIAAPIAGNHFLNQSLASGNNAAYYNAPYGSSATLGGYGQNRYHYDPLSGQYVLQPRYNPRYNTYGNPAYGNPYYPNYGGRAISPNTPFATQPYGASPGYRYPTRSLGPSTSFNQGAYRPYGY